MNRTKILALLAAPAILAAAACDTPPALSRPDAYNVASPAPDSFDVALHTSRGTVVIRGRRAWAPAGADRFYHLARVGYFDGNRFFRVLPGFIVQFGAHGDPRVFGPWRERAIDDEPVLQGNYRGTVTFAAAGPNTRSTQLFINLGDNEMLDGMGFSPLGEVVAGMGVVDSLYAGYGEGAPQGTGPDQMRIAREGNRYLERSFPLLDHIDSARVVPVRRRP
jgi:peptidyl-prolyl cis-trans isomerase A (cyclophilin A)